MQLPLMFVFLAFFSLALAQPAAAGSCGVARKVNGEVQYRSASQGSYGTLAAGTALAEGGWVRTGRNGWVELQLVDGSTLTLANATELELAKLTVTKGKKEGVFHLAQGKLRASVLKLAGQQADIRVKSGTAVAGVKGTEFLMLTVGPANVFFGNEGSVAVTGVGKESKLLEAETMTQTTRGYDPVDPVRLEPGTPLAEARDSFNHITGANPPADWLTGDNLPAIIGRWNVNYGHYLADRGSYQQALQVFQIAIDLTHVAEIRADAWLERGTVHGRFLNNPRAALAEYLLVLEEYPQLPQAETALYGAGQTLYELELFDQAAARLRQYLSLYPSGRYRSSVETLLNTLLRQSGPGGGK